MVKGYIIILGFLLFTFTPLQTVKAEGMYVTTEDIISDLVFPTIDKRVTKEYGKEPFIDWNWKRIVDITYKDNHSYDVFVRIQIRSQNHDDYKEDLVKVRISPSCDSDRFNKLKCNHEFKIEVLDYKHLD